MLKNPLVGVPLKFGFMGGVLSIGLFLTLHLIGENPLILTKRLPFAFILVPLFIFFSVKEFRDFKNGGTLHFWQGIIIGFVNYTIIALISSLFIWVFLERFHPETLTEFIQSSLLLIEKNKENTIKAYGLEIYENLLAEIENTTAYIIAVDDIVRKWLIGFFFTIVLSVILRK